MKNKRLLPLSLLALLSLVSCANPQPSSSSSSSEEEITSENGGSSEGGTTSGESASSEEISSETNGSSSEDQTSESETSSSESSSSSSASESSSEQTSEEETLQTLVLDESNGKIRGNGYGSGENDSASLPDGSPFSVTYQNGMAQSPYYGQFKKSSGFLRNTNPIKGLKSIKVNYTSGASAMACFSSSSTPGAYSAIAAGETLEANGESYFFVKAGSKVLYIESIEITFLGKGGGSSNPGEKLTWDENYSSSNVSKVTDVNKNLSLYDLGYNTPSKGTQNVLVLPIEFTDSPFSGDDLNDIRTLTSGKAEDTHYWESLASYYEKSSYGQLNLSFTYADPYSVGMTAEQFYGKATSDDDRADYCYGSAKAMRDAVAAYKAKNGSDSTKKFDQDGDGFIDSVIMIYSQEQSPDYDDAGLYWAYRYWDYWDDSLEQVDGSLTENTESPVGYSYFWASLGFFYEGISGGKGKGVDAHTLIHEFGHMLGADDYYNSDGNSSTSAVNEPTGGLTMMAYNVLDHDSFNKLQYGWVDPYYVTGSAEVTLNSFTTSGDCILLADENGWNGTAFDEYVLIEYYTPTGLNELDGMTSYLGTGSLSSSGVRIWHVDNRLYLYDSNENDRGWATDAQVEAGSFGSYYPDFALSNSSKNYYSKALSSYNALTLVSPKGTRFTSKKLSSTQDLFQAGDTFSLLDSSVSSTYKTYFPAGNKLDNGNELPYKVEVVSAGGEQAKIRISKKA